MRMEVKIEVIKEFYYILALSWMKVKFGKLPYNNAVVYIES